MFDPEELERIRQARRTWEEQCLKPHLEEDPERRGRFSTPSEIEVARLYTPEDIADLDYLQDLGFPGQFPYTRGIYPTMHRGRLWTMRQFSGFGSAEETNARYKYLLAQGQTGLSVAFDTPTLY
ncbi:MAG: methylmalonyl-CoA mutase family protein, partial [Chloroflexia bacterium]